MSALITLVLVLSAGHGLGLGRTLAADAGAPPRDSQPADSIEPALMPRMPSEATSQLRSFHPLLDGLVTIAEPIREKLRELSFWNLRPDYRRGDFCISWEIEFNL